ncbi:amidohydrolase family protein [Diaminobutyricibacter tongyongensis]|uniref:Amidohydrolase family protein n=1 Tax=Leifsonia tongyongensis TaxID=1268043 RepID=A0A6L9XU33_9MICO|nr:amidohydrolase [Diaminobutyricibacter tongyongensis]NEN04816.1 amidohydrolase family protein [Diaminobutyricibacter tongyongensis]
MPETVLRNVRPWGGPAVDLRMAEGVITAVFAHDDDDPRSQTGAPYTEFVDGRGLLALPGFVNAHAHLDKSWLGLPWVSYGGEATTEGRIRHERAHRDELGIPSVERTSTLLKRMVACGTTAFRSHVDVDLGVGVEGIRHVREAVAAIGVPVGLEIVAFPQDGVLRHPGVLELLDRAAAEGADQVGGLDPASIDRDPVGQLDALFDIAERRGVGLDIHLHELGELGAFEYELIVERTRAHAMAGRVNVAHGFAIGDVPDARQRALVEAVADAGVTITTVAPVNAPRLPLTALRDAGVRVGLGTDGIRDLWGPYGTGDLLALAARMAQLAEWRQDEDLEAAVRIASSEAAGFVGRAKHDLVVGAAADVVLVDAENVQEALVEAPERRLVICGGEIVVDRLSGADSTE